MRDDESLAETRSCICGKRGRDTTACQANPRSATACPKDFKPQKLGAERLVTGIFTWTKMEHASSSYPRPDFVRSHCQWESLTKPWSFCFDDQDIGRRGSWHLKGLPKDIIRDVNVPFVFQTAASGINDQSSHQVVWYETSVSDNRSTKNGFRNILKFGAVDYEAEVWVDGIAVGFHRGGHVPFDLDITDALNGKTAAKLVVRVWDAATDLTQPRGKQYWGPKPESIFYTPSTGIWQQVGIEVVPSVRISDSSHGTVITSNDIESGDLHAEIAVSGCPRNAACAIKIVASLANVEVATSESTKIDIEKAIAKIKVNLRLTEDKMRDLDDEFKKAHPPSDGSIWRDGLAVWSPEHPVLYSLAIKLTNESGEIMDEIRTYTGMRSLSWSTGDGTFRLNDQPYFHALVLDQGYWPETGMTPPTSNSCKEDIQLAKNMGFNGCRKHQKVESPEFLYWADHLGFLVWGEMANGYEFSRQYIDRFDDEWVQSVKRDINHPCIVAWTPINETWGYGALKDSEAEQNHIRSLYYMTKTLDSTRPINDNCGWEHVQTDLSTFHDYADGSALRKVCENHEGIFSAHGGRDMFVGGAKHKEGAPILCTEFGGVNIKPKEGDIEGAWGYTTASDATDLLARVKDLMLGIVEGGHICGFVYTQL